MPWACSACTFENASNSASECEICATPRRSSSGDLAQRVWSVQRSELRNLEQGSSQVWSCSACTYENQGGERCLICDAPRLAPKSRRSRPAPSGIPSATWQCSACERENDTRSSVCDCGQAQPMTAAEEKLYQAALKLRLRDLGPT